MKKKILSTIQLLDKKLDQYLDFCVRLGLDFNIPVQFVAAQSLATPYYTATAEAIQGVPMPPVQPRVDMYEVTENKLIDIVNKYKSINNKITFDLDYGFLTEKVLSDEESKNVLFWTVNIRNDEGFFNKVLGTLETAISKKTAKPALNIPNGYIYKKPKSILHVVSPNNDYYDLENIAALSDLLDMKVRYLVDGEIGKNQIRSFIQNSPLKMDTFQGTVSFMPNVNRKEYIEKEIESANPDWVSFQNFNTNAWSRLFTDMNTNSLLLHAQRPIIIS